VIFVGISLRQLMALMLDRTFEKAFETLVPTLSAAFELNLVISALAEFELADL